MSNKSSTITQNTIQKGFIHNKKVIGPHKQNCCFFRSRGIYEGALKRGIINYTHDQLKNGKASPNSEILIAKPENSDWKASYRCAQHKKSSREREQEPSSRRAQEEAPLSSLIWDGNYRVFELFWKSIIIILYHKEE